MPELKSPSSRIASIDMMRGLVIILMMLDHVRERFYMHVRTGDPIADTIDPDLFFTRILTHFCAPVFIFLAGLSAWLYAHPSPGVVRSPSGFLFKRGVVIILIEIVLYYLVWADSFPQYLFLQVLFAIGAVMIGLSAVCRLNIWLLGGIGALIVFGHNALTPLTFEPGHLAYVPWAILHDGGDLGKIGPLTVSLSYPVLPWFGVILLGYVAGLLFAAERSPKARRAALVAIGLACLALLGILRGMNIYGETQPWSVQETLLQTVMDVINFTKYPPSLGYILFTLGIALPVLAWFDSLKSGSRITGALKTFGSVPMFVYVVHLYVLLAAYYVLLGVFGATQGERFGLPNVATIWIGAVALTLIMYPVARGFSAYKHRHKGTQPWLSYF